MTIRMNLTSAAVKVLMNDCLFGDEEPAMLPRIEVEGILHNYGFRPERIESHYDEIVELLYELPDMYQETVGGGWSFLNMCQDKDGTLWTGLHWVMEQLVALGEAAGRMKLVLPRDVWSVLPGGMPYYVVTATRFAVPVKTEEN